MRRDIDGEFAGIKTGMQMKSPADSFVRTVRAFLQLSLYEENVTEKIGAVNSFLMYYMRKHGLTARRISASSRNPFIFKHLLYFWAKMAHKINV
jgi:hypothetical protein